MRTAWMKTMMDFMDSRVCGNAPHQIRFADLTPPQGGSDALDSDLAPPQGGSDCSDRVSVFKALFFVVIPLFALMSSWVAGADEKEENLKKNLEAVLSQGMVVESIEPSPMPGSYIVKVNGQTIFATSAGDYLMIGEIYDSVREVNLGEELRAIDMVRAIESIPESEMILMGEATGRTVTVFTDIDCTYCRQFHRTVPELQNRGLTVRYLMFPRAGLQSASYDKAVSVWCSPNQAESMTVAKSGGAVEPLTCDNPVAQQYALGQQIGVRGTPTIILDNGQVIPGFVDMDELLKLADIAP